MRPELFWDRMLAYLPQSWWKTEVQRQFKQMMRKIRADFSYTKHAEVGYAVLSFVRSEKIAALISEVYPGN